MLFFGAFGFSQNVFNTAAGSFVGIGTTSPLVKLDVRTPSNISNEELAFFGYYSILHSIKNTTGLHIHNKAAYTIPSGGGTILQFTSGDPVAATYNKGFIEFNKSATTNTTISAMSFGSNAIEFMRINQDGKVRIGNGANGFYSSDKLTLKGPTVSIALLIETVMASVIVLAGIVVHSFS